jgi:hypothetical protein
MASFRLGSAPECRLGFYDESFRTFRQTNKALVTRNLGKRRGDDGQSCRQILAELEWVGSNGQLVHAEWDDPHVKSSTITRKGSVGLLPEEVNVAHSIEETQIRRSFSDQCDGPTWPSDGQRLHEFKVYPVGEQPEEAYDGVWQCTEVLGYFRPRVERAAEMGNVHSVRDEMGVRVERLSLPAKLL